MNRFEPPNNRDYHGTITKADLREAWREIYAEGRSDGLTEAQARQYADDYVAEMRAEAESESREWPDYRSLRQANHPPATPVTTKSP